MDSLGNIKRLFLILYFAVLQMEQSLQIIFSRIIYIVLLHAKDRTEITSLTVSPRMFFIFLFPLSNNFFLNEKQREKQPEYFYFHE